MKMTMFGTGYVGLVSGTCFSDLGNDVLCADIDEKKIKLLEKGVTPIFELGLNEKVERNINEGRLKFTTDLKKAVDESDLLFICVGTPSKKDGSVNLDYVFSVAKTIGQYMDSKKIIVDKSTVPVGTADKVKAIITDELAKRNKKVEFDVVSNPEFLREGAAINDFFNPDRIVVGAESDYSRNMMAKLYKGIARTTRPIVFTDTRSAELIKYASNAMLATRISFVNQLSLYCEKVGADITAVSKGMGLDTRIGSRFLYAGIGYGGSCFPKDVKGIVDAIKEEGCSASILEAVHKANEDQKRSVITKIESMIGDVKNKTIAIWGLSFKPKTDDIRDAPSLVVVKYLLDKGANVKAFDPEAIPNFKKEFPKVEYVDRPYDALENADLLLLLTEWDEFRNPDFEKVKNIMNTTKLIDGRNIYLAYREDLEKMGFQYQGVGVKSSE